MTKPKEPEKIKITYYSDKKVYEKIKDLSEKQGRTVTELHKEAMIRLLIDYKINF